MKPEHPSQDMEHQPTEHQPPADALSLTRRMFLAGSAAASAALTLRPASAQTLPQAGELMSVQLRVNGKTHSLRLEPRVSLLDTLREHIGLTGTKKGCDHGQCGACTVLVDGRRINSCLKLAVTLDGAEITTIEGLGQPGNLHPLQSAFCDHDAFQCGYCTPGQICSATGMLEEIAAGWPSHVSDNLEGPFAPSHAEIAERMSGNLCRCAAYTHIVAAIQQAAKAGSQREDAA